MLTEVACEDRALGNGPPRDDVGAIDPRIQAGVLDGPVSGR